MSDDLVTPLRDLAANIGMDLEDQPLPGAAACLVAADALEAKEREIAALRAEHVRLLSLSQLVMYEDDLPADVSEAEYALWFACSRVDGVRFGPHIDVVRTAMREIEALKRDAERMRETLETLGAWLRSFSKTQAKVVPNRLFLLTTIADALAWTVKEERAMSQQEQSKLAGSRCARLTLRKSGRRQERCMRLCCASVSVRVASYTRTT